MCAPFVYRQTKRIGWQTFAANVSSSYFQNKFVKKNYVGGKELNLVLSKRHMIDDLHVIMYFDAPTEGLTPNKKDNLWKKDEWRMLNKKFKHDFESLIFYTFNNLVGKIYFY